MTPYRHILLATDFSELALNAAHRATDLAEHYKARMTIFHVIEHFPEDLPNDFIPPEDMDPKTFLSQQARERLQALAVEIGRPDAEISVKFSSRSAKAEILEFARYGGVDMLVLGTHGHGGVADIVGSTACGVVQHAPCDVLAVCGKACIRPRD